MEGADEKKQSILNKINDKYEKFLKEYQGCVGHYFRHLYNIVKFVDEDGPHEEKQKETLYQSCPEHSCQVMN